MKHSGLADSPFFTKQKVTKKKDENLKNNTVPMDETMVPTTPAGSEPISKESRVDTMLPRHHAITIEAVRQAVRVTGKEAATHRFSKVEKEAIAAIVYANKRQGIRTSENEIARIAVNIILQDYDVNGELSYLARVLQALNA